MKGIDINKVNASDLADIPAKVAEEVRRTVDSAYDDVSRNIKRAKKAAEGVIDESRYGIKRHPFASVGIAALAGLVTGLAIGYWVGYSTGKD